MEHSSLNVIRAEHRALTLLLQAVLRIVRESRCRACLPDFALLRAMLLYLDEFPRQLHHSEESLLFSYLRKRAPDAAEVLDRLEQEHQNGHQALLELEHALLAFEVMGESRREAFEAALHRYVDAYLAHMRLEEDAVLPTAERELGEREWAELDTVFSLNHDPLIGHPPPDAYAPLFQRIKAAVPGLAN